MKAKKVNLILGWALGIVIGAFFLLHISTEAALHTHLFFSGHPLIAITSDVSPVEFFENGEIIYEVENPPVDSATQTTLDRFTLEPAMDFLYFAKYTGV
ncbi:hypothetical protein [Enterococcus sp. HY326]|uniref:hypothetical protein n=1 Tax=Enterococcus sp. HY326 TaxID=2971265 RepID=UPI00223FDD66|nr:hypothetical protein [Enterococcus sp. HY326]